LIVTQSGRKKYCTGINCENSEGQAKEKEQKMGKFYEVEN
jgi:hypothetical protein